MFGPQVSNFPVYDKRFYKCEKCGGNVTDIHFIHGRWICPDCIAWIDCGRRGTEELIIYSMVKKWGRVTRLVKKYEDMTGKRVPKKIIDMITSYLNNFKEQLNGMVISYKLTDDAFHHVESPRKIIVKKFENL